MDDFPRCLGSNPLRIACDSVQDFQRLSNPLTFVLDPTLSIDANAQHMVARYPRCDHT